MSEIPNPGLQCWNCGETLEKLPKPISRHEHCQKCFEAVHCCRLCRHYQAQAAISCAEDRADPPANKENANFCDWFQAQPQAFSQPQGKRREHAKSQLDALFGGSDDDQPVSPGETDQEPAGSCDRSSSTDNARARLDSLFSKD